MKRIYKNLSLLFLVLLILTSCSDFLNEKSRKDVDEEDAGVYTPEAILTGAYGMLNDWAYGFTFLGITEIISDNADKGSSPSDKGTDKDVLDALTYTTSAGSFKSMWVHWYASIGRASRSISYTAQFNMQDEKYKNRLIAEAKFLRALNYFYLVRGWGGVPIQEISLVERSSSEDVYNYIEQDLNFAIEHLPLRSEYNKADIGRATKGAAQGLLAKVYLYQKRWAEANSLVDEVIKSNEYKLLDNYIDVFKSDMQYHNSLESLFEFQAKASDASIAQGVQQYSQSQGARGDTGWGWGFNTPSESLLNAFNEENDKIRRDGTIIFRNSTLYDGRYVGQTENARYNYKAYSSSAPGEGQNDRFVPYLRFAEVLLIKSEVANELGLTDEALEYLNAVRTRVQLPDVVIRNQDELRKSIWKERHLELAMEHDRWFDIVRTGQAKEAMATDGKTFIEGKHNLFPIPNELMNQVPTLIQNPNWN